MTWITTFSGMRFPLLEARPEHVVLEDIAHSLSQQCRYNGHCPRFYSVAEHSVLIAEWVERRTGSRRLALETLMHDASEAYLCDVPAPLKPLLTNYRQIEIQVERLVARRFNLAYPWHELAKEADKRIVVNEYQELFEPTHGALDWPGLEGVEPLEECNIEMLMPVEACDTFLETFHRLGATS
jgi:5'-deoxynucleotidase YfbR-like HD superfamily hydrolase